MTNYTTQAERPTVDIAVNKNRIKRYHDTSYYLQDETEFQLEFFNPTPNTLKAHIYLNDIELGGGNLVIRPGERIFLERYLDTNKKFKFKTYEVGDTDTVKNAIRNNGKIKVEFYKDVKYTPTPQIFDGNYWYNSPSTVQTPYVFTSNCNTTGDISNISTSNSTSNVEFTTTSMNSTYTSNTFLETGQISEGGSSDQEFERVNKEFEYFSFHTVEYQIFPQSQKLIMKDDIHVKRYCVECGSKLKPNFKFCPNCGTKN